MPSSATASVHGPYALLPDALKKLCARILPRLRLIPELYHWFNAFGLLDINPGEIRPSPGSSQLPVKDLWRCLTRGKPIQILLEMLSSTGATDWVQGTEPEEFLDDEFQQEYITIIINTIHALEMQGVMSFGETFKASRFLEGNAAEFIKVLKAIERILKSLEATYPGLYALPDDYSSKRDEAINQFFSEERVHLSDIRRIADNVALLRKILTPFPVVLECVEICLPRMIVFQAHLVNMLDSMFAASGVDEDWLDTFSMGDTVDFQAGLGTYHSYCSTYPDLVDFIDEYLSRKLQGMLSSIMMELLKLIRSPPSRVNYYPTFISTLLSLTHPVANHASFNSLCDSYLKICTVSQDYMDVAREVRTAWSLNLLRARVSDYNQLFPGNCGLILMDDIIALDPEHGRETGHLALMECAVFCFEKTMYFFQMQSPSKDTSDVESYLSSLAFADEYPVKAWDLGPAIRCITPLSLIHCISCESIQKTYCLGPNSFMFELNWQDGSSSGNISIRCRNSSQMGQWLHLLQNFGPVDNVPTFVQPNAKQEGSLFEGRRATVNKARTWSVTARLEQVLGTQETNDYNSLLSPSPSMLPQLFDRLSGQRPRSMLSGTTGRFSRKVHFLASPPTPPPDVDIQMNTNKDSSQIPVRDLTGQVTRTQQFPVAHGGFADIWLGEWVTEGEVRKIAIKALRGKITDETREAKMKKRLRRELRVWQRLNHKNVLPLYGTCEDFGPYTCMVCPWLGNGSIRKYFESHGSNIKLHQRLKLLCDIAAGLAYLHSFSIVHGDLSSSNVLINDDGSACLCDFGLSNIIEDLVENNYYTSSLGGAVRWAAPELFDMSTVHTVLPKATVASDVYSYGSIVLEVLSGNVPYYHLKSDAQVLIQLSKGVKPQRPDSTDITDAEWEFISSCWKEPPTLRPSTSEVTTHVKQIYHSSLKRHTL